MKLTDEENSAESGIDIVGFASGQEATQNILLLSGGEEGADSSLAAGWHLPVPACSVLHPGRSGCSALDETNVGRFAKLIAEMSETTQFVVITHSKRTMQQADVIYGVTMQEIRARRKIVSVNLGKDNRGRARSRAAGCRLALRGRRSLRDFR